MTTPEPVSPAPDTDADLRDLIADEIGRHLPNPVTGLEANQHEALYFGLARLLEGREAGLRADLDQARAERDKFADLHRGEARTHDETIASLNAVRSERDALAYEVDRLNLEIQRHQVGDGYQRGHEHGVQAGLQHAARSASAIPDDAAEQVAQCLSDYWISLRGRRQDADETEHGQAEDVDRLVRSWLAPTTGPAPAAADEVRVEMADRLYAVWELATAATRDGRGLTGGQAARIEHLTDLRQSLDPGDLA